MGRPCRVAARVLLAPARLARAVRGLGAPRGPFSGRLSGAGPAARCFYCCPGYPAGPTACFRNSLGTAPLLSPPAVSSFPRSDSGLDRPARSSCVPEIFRLFCFGGFPLPAFRPSLGRSGLVKPLSGFRTPWFPRWSFPASGPTLTWVVPPGQAAFRKFSAVPFPAAFRGSPPDHDLGRPTGSSRVPGPLPPLVSGGFPGGVVELHSGRAVKSTGAPIFFSGVSSAGRSRAHTRAFHSSLLLHSTLPLFWEITENPRASSLGGAGAQERGAALGGGERRESSCGGGARRQQRER